MASLMSKRQQARNEKALQDLVDSVPGNNSCADCNARNPAWASWSLGIFLCMRCAAIHRKLGTHISKVKSLSMDGWTNEQVENMKRIGNAASNKKYNPDNKRPPVPVDADEADSAMERFIRSKYVQKGSDSNGLEREQEQERTEYRTDRPSRGRADSDLETPPPLPPKTGGFFKKSSSKSSTFPLFRSKKSANSQHVPEEQRSPPVLRNKPSKVFGASVHNDSVDDTARKLTQLRDMGFTDDRRNAMVLKGVNGNVERTIETLVRLGEGGGGGETIPRRGSSLQTPGALPTPRSLSPSPATPTTAGLSRTSPSTANSPATSNNPWDMSPAPAPPQTAQSTGTMPNKNPFYSMTTNPFGVPAQQSDYNLNSSMQNLSLAPSQPQQLFPHHTGGLPAPPSVQQPIYQQSMTPPISQSQNFASFFSNGNQVSYQQPFQQTQPQVPIQSPQSYNPFMQNATQQQQPQQQSLSVNTAALQNQNTGSNPFARSPTARIGSSPLGQIPEQSQQNFYGTPASPYGSNPFLAVNQPVQQQQYQAPQPFDQSIFQTQQQPVQQPVQQSVQQSVQQPQYQASQQFDQSVFQPQQQQQQYQVPQQAQPVYQAPRDKAGIMALYNFPSMAPAPPQLQGQMQTNDANSHSAAPQQQQSLPPSSQQTVAHPGTKNPFLNGGTSSPTAQFASVNNAVPFGSARSRESMTLGAQMDWNNGRHSPDAFASLSARGN